MTNSMLPKIRQLLSHSDRDVRSQGVELLATFDDPSLFDAILDGVRCETRSSDDTFAPGFSEFVIDPINFDVVLRLDTVLELIGVSPKGSKLSRERDAISKLLVLDVESFDTSVVSVFPRLRELKLGRVLNLLGPTEVARPPHLRVSLITDLSSTALPTEAIAIESLERLELQSCNVGRLELPHLPALQSLRLARLYGLRAIEGLDGLAKGVSISIDHNSSLSLSTLDALITFPSCATTARELRAKARRAQNDFDGAIADMTIAIDREPSEARFESRADWLSKVGRHAESASDYSRAADYRGDRRWSHLHNRAVEESNLGDLAGAEASYREAVESKPTSAISWMGFGGVLGKQDRSEEAIEAYSRGAALEPAWSVEGVCVNNRGCRWLKLGRPDLAMDDFQRCLTIERNGQSAIHNRVEIYVRSGRWDFAIAESERYFALGYTHDEMTEFYERAKVERRQHGNTALPHEQYRPLLKRFMDADPGDRLGVVNEFVRSSDAAAIAASFDGLTWIEEGIARARRHYGLLTPRPYPDPDDSLEVADLDRYLVSLAPETSLGGQMRQSVTSLIVGQETVDLRSLGGLSRLRDLWFENATTLDAFDALAQHPTLRSVGFGACEIADEWLDALAAIGFVRELRFRSCALHANVEQIAQVKALEIIDLDYEPYDGFDALTQLDNLRELWLPRTVSVESLPERLQPLVRHH